ncbi:alpha-L-rhamnosidase [Anaerocolumna sp. MB42-C2]|uniref:alpha-L-rhamnosidase n=1 Tax=Anaerocolumna sp. MB42-C2 TaxID=3070997 RepID=UPI0027DFB381|nr:alpha-L-rhamnosidase [Anaerocolumna sp. MB42-C2]WMJ89584.1 family 78 glycoside hydrolase catalytic domain [Anaerocolumna sp. MB42-C2]
MLEVYDLKCEYKKNPNCIDTEKPRFSWKIKTDKKNVLQKSFVLSVIDGIEGTTIWRKEDNSSDSIHIPYEGEKLKSNHRYYYSVEITDNYGEKADSTEISYFETGILDPDLWSGEWIGKEKKTKRECMDICPVLRKSFKLIKRVKSARIYISAMGLYELHFNGQIVGDYVLTPGWTSYNNRIQYQCYDVTNLLLINENTIGIRLGDGWHNGEISFNHQIHTYGENIGAIAQLMITYEDDTEDTVVTDATWKTADSGVLFSEIYDGEIYDGNKEPDGWNINGFDDTHWEKVVILNRTKANLVGTINEGTKRIEEIKPIAIIKTPSGETLIDMGQNMAGWVKVTVSGRQGDKVHLKHGEVLDGNGNFYFDNIRLAKQETCYTLTGKGVEVLEPHFTFQGFRYIKILEFPGEAAIDNFTGVVIHTDMEPTAKFSCSNPLINQLWHNLVWGQKGNFIDVPTDCPQRDERLGWTGDAQIFCRTACFNFGADSFFTKWLEDVKADQFYNGAIPFVVPNVLPTDWSFLTECQLGFEQTSAAWGDVITVCPWTLYLCYGDKQILEKSYPAIEKYVAYIRNGYKNGSGNPFIWDWGPQLGDWLALDHSEGSYRGATEESFVATAYYANTVKILCKCAKVLRKEKDVITYSNLYESIVMNFKKTFMKDGIILQNTQTSQIIPLEFGLLEGEEVNFAVEKLVKLLKENNYHLTTGFIGTPYLCHVLSKNGYSEIAYRLLMQTDYPSWLYQILKGATTIWEHWDGKKPDDTFWSPNMNSFNHYAYGAIGDWLYRVVAGIEIDEEYPGYKHLIIKPSINDCIQNVTCEYESVYGKIISKWEIGEDNTVDMLVRVPANTVGTIYLPDQENTKLDVGSGEYRFQFKLNK